MPRRRTGNKATPDYPSEILPEISVLLRDARPTYVAIEGEPDLRKRRERARERDLAIDRLLKMYREAEKSELLDKLDFRVPMFYEELKQRNRGRLPKAKGGRPTTEHRSLLFAVRVQEAIERRGGKWGAVEAALKEVSDRYGISSHHLKDIYKDRDRRAVAVELELRRGKIYGEG